MSGNRPRTALGRRAGLPFQHIAWLSALMVLLLGILAMVHPMDAFFHPEWPRFTELPAFDPHRKDFECKHEAEANPPIGPQAQELFEQALALDHWELWYEQIDHKGMARLYEQAMKLGHWKAQLNLAQMHLEGLGVPADADEAIRLTEDLMRQGVPAAWHRMGSLYMMGGGPLRQDATVAYAFWQRAADMGSMESQALLGEKLDADHDSPPSYWGNEIIGVKMLECSFEQGSGEAAYRLGISLDQSARTPKAYRRALEVMHEGVKRGHQASANYLFASFHEGDSIVDRAKDPFRARRYKVISERLRLDHHLKLPNLDRVLPLPPAALPHWNSDPDTLIDAAKGVRVTPQPVTTSAHRLPSHNRAHIPPGHMLQVPAGWAQLARRPPMPGLGNILAEGPFTPGMARAPVEGYWQARALPAHPQDEPYTTHLRREFSDLLPMHFHEGERMQLTMGDSNLLHDESVHGLVEWHFVGEAVPQRVPQDWQAQAGRVRAIAAATRITCASGQPCPQSGIWQPYALDKAHPAAPLLSTAALNESWKRQAFVQQGEPLPSLSAQGLPMEDAQVGWWLMQACEAGFSA